VPDRAAQGHHHPDDADCSEGDRILLQGLRFSAVHGALPEEKSRPQPFEVDLELTVDLRAAGGDDELTSTVDYGRLAEVVRTVMEGPPANLLERLAQLVAEGVLASYPGRARRVLVTVRKLAPPLPLPVTYAAVRICRP
jgi:7,8-dihydroneopterin aldolase/epimerase/oxygenase